METNPIYNHYIKSPKLNIGSPNYNVMSDALVPQGPKRSSSKNRKASPYHKSPSRQAPKGRLNSSKINARHTLSNEITSHSNIKDPKHPEEYFECSEISDLEFLDEAHKEMNELMDPQSQDNIEKISHEEVQVALFDSVPTSLNFNTASQQTLEETDSQFSQEYSKRPDFNAVFVENYHVIALFPAQSSDSFYGTDYNDLVRELYSMDIFLVSIFIGRYGHLALTVQNNTDVDALLELTEFRSIPVKPIIVSAPTNFKDSFNFIPPSIDPSAVSVEDKERLRGHIPPKPFRLPSGYTIEHNATVITPAPFPPESNVYARSPLPPFPPDGLASLHPLPTQPAIIFHPPPCSTPEATSVGVRYPVQDRASVGIAETDPYFGAVDSPMDQSCCRKRKSETPTIRTDTYHNNTYSKKSAHSKPSASQSNHLTTPRPLPQRDLENSQQEEMEGTSNSYEPPNLVLQFAPTQKRSYF